jgi:hypothetical protein
MLRVGGVVVVRARPPVTGVIYGAGVGTELDREKHEDNESEGNEDHGFHALSLFTTLEQSKSKVVSR